MPFDQFVLSAPLSRALSELGFSEPTPIQREALPVLLGGSTDFLGLAATGTGKTAAFGIPLLERLKPGVKQVQAIVLCPTRELAVQVSEQVDQLAKYSGFRSVAVYGGASFIRQVQALKESRAVVVGTPGRVLDHLERGTLKLDRVETVVLDEADEMISMGFREDIEAILEKTSRRDNNVWLFSATMGNDVRKVADRFLRDPKRVQVNRSEIVPSQIRQVYYTVRDFERLDLLTRILDVTEDFYGLIFCQTKQGVIELTAALEERGFRVDCLHGDKTQDARERTMRAFRERRLRVLVCTDVASRGLDVKDLTHVINYSLPRELDSYVHRIGRTARSGKAGVAMSFVGVSHLWLIGKIEKATKSKMELGVPPSRRIIAEKRLKGALQQFESQPFSPDQTDLLGSHWKQILAGKEKTEIAVRLLTLMDRRLLDAKEFAEENNEKLEKPWRSHSPFKGKGRGPFRSKRPRFPKRGKKN